MAHHRLSPSSAYRWSRCSAAPSLEVKYPEVVTKSSLEGNVAHELAENCLSKNERPIEFIGGYDSARRAKLTKELCSAVDFYVKYVITRGGDQLYEEKLNLEEISPGMFGTADAVILFGDTIEVVDFKYGKSVVDPTENLQLLAYMCGASAMVNDGDPFTKFKMTIVQPRCRVPVSSWEIDRETLDKWKKFLQDSAEKTIGDNTEFVPGELQCNFCKVQLAGECEAFNNSEFNIKFELKGKEKA